MSIQIPIDVLVGAENEKLTKRDRFALAALQGLLANPCTVAVDGYMEDFSVIVSNLSFKIADTMMCESAKN